MVLLLIVAEIVVAGAGASGEGARYCGSLKTLKLPAQSCAKVGAFAKLVSALERRNSVVGLCDVLRKAEALWLELRSKLNDRFGEIKPGKAGEAAAKAFSAEVKKLSDFLRGVSFAVGAEGVYAFVDYNELAVVNGAKSPGTGLLRASAKWFGGRWPIFRRQITDNQGCVELGVTVRNALKGVAAGWRKAPKCAKDVIGPQLDQGFRDFSFSSCYCQPKAAARADAKLLAPVLSEIPGTSGKDRASALLGMVQSAEALFDARCGF